MLRVPEEYRIAIELQEKESDRYWSRSNVLLLVHGALISFYITVAGDGSWYTLVVAVEGVFLGLIWLSILHRGKRYVSRWGEAAAQVEHKASGMSLMPSVRYPILQYYQDARAAEPMPRFFMFRKNTTTLMRYAVYSLIAFWLLAGGAYILQLATDSASPAPIPPTIGPSPTSTSLAPVSD